MNHDARDKVTLERAASERNKAYKSMAHDNDRKQASIRAQHERLERKKSFNRRNSFGGEHEPSVRRDSGFPAPLPLRMGNRDPMSPSGRQDSGFPAPLPSLSEKLETGPTPSTSGRRDSGIPGLMELPGKTRRHSIGIPNKYGQSSQKIIEQLNQRSSVGKPQEKPTPIMVGQAPPNLDRLGPAPGKLPSIPESERRASVDIPLKPRRSSMVSERELGRRGSILGSTVQIPLGRRESTASTSSVRRPPSYNEGFGSQEDLAAEEAAQREHLRELLNKAIKTVQDTDVTATVTKGKAKKFSAPSVLDIAALNDLQGILNEARQYAARRNSNDTTQNRQDSSRAQRRRISHLEDVLKQLNPKQLSDELEPEKVLACSYLRLTKHNIETMEDLIRQEGKVPGIHAHSDVENYDVFANLSNERTDLNRELLKKTSTDSTPTVTGRQGKKLSRTSIKLSNTSMPKVSKTSLGKVSRK